MDAFFGDIRFAWRGLRREFSVLRQRLDASDGRVLLAAVWRDLVPLRRREAQRVAAIEQLEQQQRANEQLRREMQDHTLRDTETGLYNRAHFEDQLRREVDLSTREHREFAMVLIEIDPFAGRVREIGAPAESRTIRLSVISASVTVPSLMKTPWPSKSCT